MQSDRRGFSIFNSTVSPLPLALSHSSFRVRVVFSVSHLTIYACAKENTGRSSVTRSETETERKNGNGREEGASAERSRKREVASLRCNINIDMSDWLVPRWRWRRRSQKYESRRRSRCRATKGAWIQHVRNLCTKPAKYARYRVIGRDIIEQSYRGGCRKR